MKIKGLFIDLDNCVFDTKSMGESLVAPVLDALIEADQQNFFKKENFSVVSQDLWTLSLDDVAQKHSFPKEILAVARQAYCQLEAPAWSKNYTDVNLLKQIKQKKILVTSGYSKLQWSKLRVTGIGDLFDQIIIDAIDNPQERLGKKTIFAQLATEHGWLPGEVMVIGDSAFSELGAGKELGMVTVQILRPRVQIFPGFDHYVDGFEAVISLLKRYQ